MMDSRWGDRAGAAFNYESFKEDDGNWASSRRRYEWKEDYETTGIAPRDPELEKELFNPEDAESGINFTKYSSLPGKIETSEGSDWNDVKEIKSFSEAKLHPVVLETLELCGYKMPTPIQRYAIPFITKGADVMACAQTGSGKTAAFVLPVVSRLMGKAKKLSNPRKSSSVEPLALIIAPTRELVTQIFDECRKFCYRSMLRPAVIYGGAPTRIQMDELLRGCDLLVATPGRLLDFMSRRVSLTRCKYVVLDEADRMLDMGFEGDMRRIMKESDLKTDDTLQTLMFSATFRKDVRRLARDFLADDFVRVQIGRIGSTTTDITQKVYESKYDNEEKRQQVFDLISKLPPTKTLIFVRSKRGADALDDYLYNKGVPTTSIHGDRTQREREDALMAFRSGTAPVLIATDVAARGLDIKGCMHVINYELPSTIDEYVHRIGRTARIGHQGLATSFYSHSDENIAQDLVDLLAESGQEIPEILQEFHDPSHLKTMDNYDLDEDIPEDEAEVAGEGGAGEQNSGWGASQGDAGW